MRYINPELLEGFDGVECFFAAEALVAYLRQRKVKIPKEVRPALQWAADFLVELSSDVSGNVTWNGEVLQRMPQRRSGE